MDGTLTFGRVRGIAVGVHWSVLFVLVLIPVTLGASRLPPDVDGYSTWEYSLAASITAVAFPRVDPRPRRRRRRPGLAVRPRGLGMQRVPPGATVTLTGANSGAEDERWPSRAVKRRATLGAVKG